MIHAVLLEDSSAEQSGLNTDPLGHGQFVKLLYKFKNDIQWCEGDLKMFYWQTRTKQNFDSQEFVPVIYQKCHSWVAIRMVVQNSLNISETKEGE